MDMDRLRQDANGGMYLYVQGHISRISPEDAHLLEEGSPDIHEGYIRIVYNKCRKAHKTKRYRLARMIMQPSPEKEVDHINHDILDNRRCNLRVCTRSENRRNSRGQANRKHSQYKGVTYLDSEKYGGKALPKPWRAYTRINGKRHWIGYYETEAEAAEAYNEYAQKQFGDFACCNSLE